MVESSSLASTSSTKFDLAPTPSTSTLSGAPASASVARRERALDGIRTFLESKSCYDILPESFRKSPSSPRSLPPAPAPASQQLTFPPLPLPGLIVFDNKLSITRSLQALVTNGAVHLPPSLPPPPPLLLLPRPNSRAGAPLPRCMLPSTAVLLPGLCELACGRTMGQRLRVGGGHGAFVAVFQLGPEGRPRAPEARHGGSPTSLGEGKGVEPVKS